MDIPTGQTGWIDTSEPVDFKPGDTVLLGTNREIELAPEEVWSEDPWVAVVRIKNPDKTVVESGGSAKVIPTRSDIEYHPGNTVEATAAGVQSVLSERPIKLFDLPEVDDSSIEPYIYDVSKIKENYSDFAGLHEVIARAKRLIEIPLRHADELAEIGARRVKGVLFTGAPGTGKTMLARIIARESGATFYQISGPEVVSKWHGQTEEILRRLFAHAESRERAIIFFDEIDSIASQRDEDAHEASKRTVAQLLTLMDGFNASNVMVIATTNRPQDIDRALLRPGRFDWEITFPLPDRGDREAILRTGAQRVETYGVLPIREIADRSDSWSPAELMLIWAEAALLAVTDGRRVIMWEDCVGGFERASTQRARPIDVSPSN
ncbi:ATP-binding protein [Nonomuraea zeae]|uniref:ATP-binding protein n=1 Tax=Nonomuraea zeae TaxID=1642303 RepID=UPI0014781EBF|nr:ATP-binding protein [Nonomuraea zeae]